jgi:hypothetical protein
MAAPRPLADVDPETDKKFMFASVRLFYLSYLANLMNNEPGSKPEDAARQSAKFTQQMNEVRDSMAFLKDSHPEMWDYLNNLAKAPRVKPPMPAPQPQVAGVSVSNVVVAGGKNAELPPSVTQQRPPLPANVVVANNAANNPQRRRQGASDLPFMQSVFDAGIWINGSDPDLTVIDVKPGVPRDMNILPHANVAAPGPIVPRQPYLLRRRTPRRPRHRQPRLGLALRQTPRCHPQRFRRSGRKAHPSRTPRRSRRALHRQRLVPQMAAP